MRDPVTLIFPVDVTCSDKHCPTREFAVSHTHTLYNSYTVPVRFSGVPLSELEAMAVCTSSDLYLTSPAADRKDVANV